MAKLLVESIEEVQVLTEGDESSKSLYVEGIFLQADIFNKNRRKYPKHIMQKEVARYMKEHISRRNAYGELGHPEGPTINPDRISHLITSLREDGSNFIGKAKVLDTPCGKIAGTLIKEGTLGVSSRGLGSLVKIDGGMQVQEDFMLATAADFVINPSAPDAFVDGLMEGHEWIWNPITKIWEAQQVVDMINENARQLDEAVIVAAWEKFLRAL